MIVGYRSRSISFKFKSACRSRGAGRRSGSSAGLKHNVLAKSICHVARNIKSETTPRGFK